MKSILAPLCVLVLLVIVGFYAIEHREFIIEIKTYIEGANSFSQVAYVLLLVASGVFLPFSAMPLIPFASAVFGPLQTAFLSVIGWTLGAVGAFLLARYYGRPVVEQYVSLSKIDALAAMLPAKNKFVTLFIFRLVIPSDMANYALGLTKSLGFKDYFLATFVVHVWYSVLLAYLGEAVLSGNNAFAAKLLFALLVIFSIGWYLLRRSKN